MAIDPVATENTMVLQPGPSQVAAANPMPQPAPEAGRGVALSGDQVQLSGNPDSKYQALQQKNELSNAAAGAIRNTDRSLESFSQKIDKLKAPLETIVKNFPPFSPEDKAREKLLMNYSSIRKEIDQLTLPAPPDIVQAHKVAALPAPLPVDATDSPIADHVAKLDATGAALNGLRVGLAADTTALVHDGRFSYIFSSPTGSQIGLSEAPLTESGASQKSVQVGRQFAAVVSQGVTAASSQFLKGMS